MKKLENRDHIGRKLEISSYIFVRTQNLGRDNLHKQIKLTNIYEIKEREQTVPQ